MVAKYCLIFSLSIILLCPQSGSAKDSACDSLGMQSESVYKCRELQKVFELEGDAIAACKGFSNSDSGKINCVRAGANFHSVKFCLSLKFHSEENSLSCLHYVDDIELAKACAKISSKELDIIQCLKSGHDISWVNSCNGSPNEKSRMFCLKNGPEAAERGLASTQSK